MLVLKFNFRALAALDAGLCRCHDTHGKGQEEQGGDQSHFWPSNSGSEYWHRQFFATYQTDPVGIELLRHLGEDNVMWGNDFPHPDGIWPDSQEFLSRELTGVSAEAKRKVVRDNAMKLYRLGN